MMWWWGDGRLGAMGWIGMAFMVVVWVLVIAGIVFFVRSLLHGSDRHPAQWGPPYYGPGAAPRPGGEWQGGPSMRSANPEALRVLEERYAKGEIDREEFLQKRADLTGQAPGADDRTG